MRYKGLLFDVDGVLVNSEKVRIDYFQKIFEDRATNFSKDLVSQMVGKSTPVFFQELVRDHGLDKNSAEEILENYSINVKQYYPQNVVPIAETVNFILSYNGNSKIGIATVNSRIKALEVLSHLNLNTLVKAVISRDDIIKQKPDPEAYLSLAKILGLSPNDCAVIEDTVTGAQAGINAGMDCYVFLNSYNSKDQFKGIAIKGFISSTEDLKNIAL